MAHVNAENLTYDCMIPPASCVDSLHRQSQINHRLVSQSQEQAKMICKAGSHVLLAKSSSMQSLKSLSPSSSMSESGSRRLAYGLTRAQRSSSSLYLQDLSLHSQAPSLSSSSFMDDSFSQHTLSDCSKLSRENYFETKTDCTNLVDAGGVKLAQYILLLALAIQIPNFLDEFIESFELNLQSIPFLVMLGVLPSMFWIRGKQDDEAISLKDHEQLVSRLRSMSSIGSMTRHDVDSRAGYEDRCESHNQAPSLDGSTVDEWGHFTELDEQAIGEKDVTFIINPSTNRRSSTNLGTLREEAEEEEEFSF